MTSLAQGTSITLALQDGGQVNIATNGGLASFIATPTGGAAQSQNMGPLPVRMTVGPFSEGASVTIYNQNAVLDYDLPGRNIPGIPSAFTSRALGVSDDSANLICATAQIATVNTGLPSGFGCSFKGAITFNGTATVTDVRTTGSANPWCALSQTGPDTYDVIGTKA